MSRRPVRPPKFATVPADVWAMFVPPEHDLTRSAADLGTTSQVRAPKTQADYEHDLETYITQRCSLIATNLLEASLVIDKARADPGQDFLIPDAKLPSLPNLMSVHFHVDQAAFLAGYLAAGMTRTGTVATFGGIPAYTVIPYMNGFAAGVLDYNKENGASVRLLGWDPVQQDGAFISHDATNFQAFTNEAKARRMVSRFISRGADIVFPVAGEAGLGAGPPAKPGTCCWLGGLRRVLHGAAVRRPLPHECPQAL